VEESPVEQLLAAVDRLDVGGVMALFAPSPRFLAADGRRAEGTEAVRELFTAFFAPLRSAMHRITAQWHEDNAWIAEVDADYELQDWLRLNALPRAFVVRVGEAGIADVRVYGAHEHPLTEHPTGEEGMWVRGMRWIPPL
jgi:SnoaL-like domain